MSDQSDLTRNSLRAECQQITEIGIEDLVQEQRLGTESDFSELREEFQRSQSICRQLANTPLDLVPDGTVHELREKLPDHTLQMIRSFKPDPGSPGHRISVIQGVQKAASEFSQLASPVVASRAVIDVALRQLTEKVTASLSEADEKVETVIGSLRSDLQQARALVGDTAQNLDALEKQA